jgi:hypothetical protein
MPELELAPEGHESDDPAGKRVGVQAAILAVFLAIVTIASHRAHTTAVIVRTEANDQWSFYQSKRMKFHNLELGEDLLKLMTRGQESQAAETLARYETERKRYDKEAEEVQHEAQQKEAETKLVEAQALRFDIGEGMLEIGVVLSSLYFIAKRRIFPVTGAVFGILGCIAAATGLLL